MTALAGVYRNASQLATPCDAELVWRQATRRAAGVAAWVWLPPFFVGAAMPSLLVPVAVGGPRAAGALWCAAGVFEIRNAWALTRAIPLEPLSRGRPMRWALRSCAFVVAFLAPWVFVAPVWAPVFAAGWLVSRVLRAFRYGELFHEFDCPVGTRASTNLVVLVGALGSVADGALMAP